MHRAASSSTRQTGAASRDKGRPRPIAQLSASASHGRRPLLQPRNAGQRWFAVRPRGTRAAAVVSAEANSMLAEGLTNDFSSRDAQSFAMGILGDLHLEPDNMELHEEARRQFRERLQEMDPQGARIVQLGDLTGYSSRPGCRDSTEFAADYLRGFDLPFAAILGNHDLEAEDIDTDEENLAAWQQVMHQRHYWAADLGSVMCIGLSTTRFRSNAHSVHEVHIDEQQLQWFVATLQRSGGRPVIVFTHAPPMGSGLQVVQEVHVKNRCAWLNHSSNPAAFLRLVQRFPNVRLWFSGHFHLSHNYADSISVVGGCAFVQTGVIGDCNRDGYRQSRLLQGNRQGFRLYTLDHEDGSLRLDLQHAWDSSVAPRPELHEDELICDPSSGGWLCSQLWCDVAPPQDNPLTPRRNTADWFAVGGHTAVARQAHMLVEYDVDTRSPIGLVCRDLEEEEEVVLLDAQQRQLAADGSDSHNGEDVVWIELRHRATGTARQFERNGTDRRWYRIMQHNKWRARLEAEAEAAQHSSPATLVA